MALHDQFLAHRFHTAVNLNRFYFDWLYTSTVLNFTMQQQTQSQWCWAATSTSVSKFYSWLSPWTQCKVASEAMGESCCVTPVPGACNQPWFLNLALEITENFVSYQGGTISWADIKSQLDAGLVVGARIGWNGGGGHFMVIHGVSRQAGIEFLHIDDPIYGKSTLTYQTFATNYQGSGTWTHTYFTKKKFYFMWYKDLVFDTRLFDPIYKVRPLLDLHGFKGDLTRAVPETAFSTAHYNFIIGLDAIKRDMKMPAEPASLRVVEIDDEKAVALYEVGVDPDRPELINMNSDSDMFDRLDSSLEALRKHGADAKQPPELRSVRAPALNIEALWLHFPGSTEDKFKLVRSFGGSQGDANKVYGEAEFKELLLALAEIARKQDDEMGA